MDNNMEIENNGADINKMDIEQILSTTITTTTTTTTTTKASITSTRMVKKKTFEDLFWAVFNNKYIRNYLFRILQSMKFQGDSIKSFYIGNRQPFSRICKLSWMVKRKAWSLLKLKLNCSLEFPTESKYVEFYHYRDIFSNSGASGANHDEHQDTDSEDEDIQGVDDSYTRANKVGEIIPGGENDEYLQITAKGVSMLFKECKDLEIIRLLYMKKRDQLNIVGDILKVAVQSKNEAAVKFFLESDQFKGTISTKAALEWCIENDNHQMAAYLFSIDPSVRLSSSKLFSVTRSNEITKFILDNESLYQDVTPKSSLISYKVFIETKSSELQSVMVSKGLVGKESLPLLDLQNRITFKKKEVEYNPAVVAYLNMYFKKEEIINSRYQFFIHQLVHDVLQKSENIQDAIEKAREGSCSSKIIGFIFESSQFIHRFKLDSSFSNLVYLLTLPEIKECTAAHYDSFFKNSKDLSFSMNEIKTLIPIFAKIGHGSGTVFIKFITPIKDLNQDDTFTIIDSLHRASDIILILNNFFIQVSKKCDITGLKSILEFKDRGFPNFHSIFEVNEMFTECQDDAEMVSHFVSILLSSQISFPSDILLKSVAKKFVHDASKFIQIASLLPISPELSKLIKTLLVKCLKEPNQNSSKETLNQLICSSAHHLSSSDIDDLFEYYIEQANIGMLNALLESVPDFFRSKKQKVISCSPEVINWFMEKNQSKSFSRLDFSFLLDVLIEEQSPFDLIEMVFNYLVSNSIYQLAPKKFKGVEGDFISYKAVKLSLESDYEQVFTLLFSNHQLFYWEKSLFSMELTEDSFKDMNNINSLFRNNNSVQTNKKIKKDNKCKQQNNNNNNNNNNNDNIAEDEELLDYESDDSQITNTMPSNPPQDSTSTQISASISVPTLSSISVPTLSSISVPTLSSISVPTTVTSKPTTSNDNVKLDFSNRFKYTFNSNYLSEDLPELVAFGEVKDALNYLKSKTTITVLPKATVFKIIKYSSLELIIEYFKITNYQQLSDEEVVEKIFKHGRNDLIEVLFKSHYNELERSFKKCARYNNFNTVTLLLRLFNNKYNNSKSPHLVNLAHQLIKEAIMTNDIIIFNILYFNFEFKLSLESFIQDYSQSESFHYNFKVVKKLLDDIKYN